MANLGSSIAKQGRARAASNLVQFFLNTNKTSGSVWFCFKKWWKTLNIGSIKPIKPALTLPFFFFENLEGIELLPFANSGPFYRVVSCLVSEVIWL